MQNNGEQFGNNSGHKGFRDVFRAVGPILLAIGILLIVITFVDFFSAINYGGRPRFFWCFFLAMPFVAVGGSLTKLGYMGTVARYVAEEVAPVGKDTFNYLADETSQGVEKIAMAIGSGINADSITKENAIKCAQCNKPNAIDANFCKNCGSALQKSKPCLECNELNSFDAKFCDKCGYRFESI